MIDSSNNLFIQPKMLAKPDKSLFIMRHGRYDLTNMIQQIQETGEHGDPSLSQEGVLEVQAEAEKILYMPISLIFSSPTQRAQESGKIVSDKTGFEVECIEELRELDMPTGDSLQRLIKDQNHWGTNWLNQWSGMERTEKYVERTKYALYRVLQEVSQVRTPLIIAHEETVWAVKHILQGISLDKAIQEKVPYATVQKISVPNDAL